MHKILKYINHVSKIVKKCQKSEKNPKTGSCQNLTISALHSDNKQTLNSYYSVKKQLPKNQCKI